MYCQAVNVYFLLLWMNMIKVTSRPYQLALKHPFTIANSSRTHTPIVLLELQKNGAIGFGEASLPPYLPENQESVIKFIQKIDFSIFKDNVSLEDLLYYVDNLTFNDHAAKAAIDIALHDLFGKLENQACYLNFGSDPDKMPPTAYTIGIDNPEIMASKIKEEKRASILKIKLGTKEDKKLINSVVNQTDKKIMIDVNQGWKDRDFALEMCYCLADKSVLFIEQPLPKNNWKDLAWLKQKSPIPILADESFQTLEDLPKMADCFHGINIKLMKCGGMHMANKIINEAKKCKLKILMGCMTESSCATLAAAALAPKCDWADLDGPMLITNNPFKVPNYVDGKIILSSEPGLGLKCCKKV